jgi:hypothetical protein
MTGVAPNTGWMSVSPPLDIVMSSSTFACSHDTAFLILFQHLLPAMQS